MAAAKRYKAMAIGVSLSFDVPLESHKGRIMTNPPDTISLSAEEGEALIARVRQSSLSQEDAGVVEQVIRMYFWVVFCLQEAKLSLKRLRMLLFGKGTQTKKAATPEASLASPQRVGEGDGAVEVLPLDEETSGAQGAKSETGSGECGNAPPPTPPRGHRPGTGRLGGDAYAGAERVECRHEDLAVGQRCPVCGQGTLYELPPKIEIRIDGHALLSALRYALQRLRCSACGEIFPAPLPEEAGQEKYSARARAVVAGSR